jgi:hypothetical protein
VLFLIHQILQGCLHIHIRFIDNYLDPILAMPILLFIFDWELEFFRNRPKLNMSEIMASFIIFSVIFEGLFPYFSAKFTKDYWDVFAYLLGTTLYFLVRENEEMSKFT